MMYYIELALVAIMYLILLVNHFWCAHQLREARKQNQFLIEQINREHRERYMQ